MTPTSIYVNITKVLLNEAGNSIGIFSKYFSNLFNAHYFTPKEVLNIYQNAETELKHIYLKCLAENSYIDYRGTFLSEFIMQDIDWIKWYAKYIQETQESYSVNDKEYRLDTCWQQENYLNVFDLYFEELLCEKPLYWHSRGYFQKFLSFDGQKEIDSQKEQ